MVGNFPRLLTLAVLFLAGAGPAQPDFACPDVASPPGVDVLDVATIAAAWPLDAGSPEFSRRLDLDSGGAIDVADIERAAGQWGTAGQPASIEFTAVPAYGTQENLQGRIGCAAPAGHRVAVYIYVGGWWTKPTFADPLTPIQANGAWQADVTTGGSDSQATRLAAFLLPAGTDPPPMAGGQDLPAELLAFPQVMAERPPGSRTIRFAGYTWTVKAASASPVGPGPNYFSDDPADVWVDEAGRLHLRIVQRDGRWWSGEVVNHQPLAHGAYRFTLAGPVDALDPNIVVGLFTWDGEAAAHHYREIDVELSRWTDPQAANAQFVVQPWDTPGNIHRFAVAVLGEATTYRFDWQPDRVDFAAYQGRADPPQPADLIEAWAYTGADVPPAGSGSARINFWLVSGLAPQDGQAAELIVESYGFSP